MRPKKFSIFAIVLGVLSVFSVFNFKANGIGDKDKNVPFEFRIFNSINKNDNFMISPISLEMVLMMLANEDVTEDVRNEILSAYGITDFEAYQKWAFDFLVRIKDKNIVDINNSIWFNTGIADPVDSLFDRRSNWVHNEHRRKIRGSSSHFNFFTDKFKVNRLNAKYEINNWISEKTKGTIPGLDIDDDFSVLLLNATYFKKAWETPFNKYRTHNAHFNNADGSVAETAFMTNDENYNFYENTDFKMVELPYQGKDASMYVFVPKNENIESFNYQWLEEGIKNKRERYITLSLPKFCSRTDLCLNEILKTLGIESIFKPNSVYSVSSISDILHKTYIDVSEEGTEASAVTAAIAKCCLAPSFVVDKPFVYVIRENTSGKILFMGSQCKF